MCCTTTMPGPSWGMAWSKTVRASVPPVEAPTATIRSDGTPAAGPGRGGSTASAVRRGEGARRRRSTRAWAAPPHGVHQHDRGLVEELADVQARLRDDVERALLERAHRRVRPLAGQRGADDDGNRVFGHEPREELEAVHARQLEVEDDHVGPLPRNLLHGDVRVGRGRRLDAFEREQRRQRLADDRRVVDDEHLQRPRGRGRRGRGRSGSRPAGAHRGFPAATARLPATGAFACV